MQPYQREFPERGGYRDYPQQPYKPEQPYFQQGGRYQLGYAGTQKPAYQGPPYQPYQERSMFPSQTPRFEQGYGHPPRHPEPARFQAPSTDAYF